MKIETKFSGLRKRGSRNSNSNNNNNNNNNSNNSNSSYNETNDFIPWSIYDVTTIDDVVVRCSLCVCFFFFAFFFKLHHISQSYSFNYIHTTRTHIYILVIHSVKNEPKHWLKLARSSMQMWRLCFFILCPIDIENFKIELC